MVSFASRKMADDLLIAFDNFDHLFPTSERRLLPVANPFEAYDDKKFRERFRLSKSVVQCLLDEIAVNLEPERCCRISPMNQLLITLRFYATGTFQLVIGDTFNVHKSTVCRVVHRVTALIASLRPKYVLFPATAQERHNMMNAFYMASGMPGVIGAVDCTHVPIQSPGGEDGEIYRNRKGYFSINVQLICDKTGYIIDVVARWPGSVHDSTIFDNSHVRVLMERSVHEGYLVGDSGYPCRRYLLTPVTNPGTNAARNYNAAHIAARNCIERANGILKRRFPALKYGMRVTVEHALPMIVATVVLNNIALTMGDAEPPVDEMLSTHIHKLRQDGIAVDFDPVEVAPPDSAGHSGAFGMRQALVDNHFG